MQLSRASIILTDPLLFRMAAVPFGYIHEARGPFLTTQPRAKGRRLPSPCEPKSPQHGYGNRALFFMRRRKAISSCPDLSCHLQATFSSLDHVRPLLRTQPLFTLTSCVRSQSLTITANQPTFFDVTLIQTPPPGHGLLARNPGRQSLCPPRHVLLVCYSFGYKNATRSWLARKCKNVGIVHRGQSHSGGRCP